MSSDADRIERLEDAIQGRGRHRSAGIMITVADYDVLRGVVESALPQLDFSDPDQELAGHEMLWMLNAVWARIEWEGARG
jgi:hypothetical protein